MSEIPTSAPSKYLITIVGPTAVGKTALAIKLANQLDCPILSADSRQFFKEMSIGTAKPTADELAQAEHHFVDFLFVEDEYSAGQFERDGLKLLEDLFQNKDVVILSGGSGLYVNAVLSGFDELPSSPEARTELMARLDKEGLEALYAQLIELDPIRAAKVDPSNMQRVIRSLEVCLGTGKPYSSFISDTKKERPFTSIVIGLNLDRELLYERINTRVDAMVAEGLIDEVKSLEDRKALNSLNTVGYSELFDHFAGEKTLDEAISDIKKSTRHFAKRQLTWFRRMEGITWFEPQEFDEISSHIQKGIKN